VSDIPFQIASEELSRIHQALVKPDLHEQVRSAMIIAYSNITTSLSKKVEGVFPLLRPQPAIQAVGESVKKVGNA
jgi:hypothetical protein